MQRNKILLALLLLTYSCEAQRRDIREDGKCGPGNTAPNGRDAICEDIPPFPTCCQRSGHCGWDCEGVAGPSSSSSATGGSQTPVSTPSQQQPVFISNGNFRSDGRCGSEFPLEDGVTPAECDPNSQYWCCSDRGWCGGTQEHCYCADCINFRPVNEENGVRSDRRCGPDFPLSDGTPAKCDGNSANHCCSDHGYCGPGAAHCDCVGCTDFRSGSPIQVPVLSGRVRNDRRCGREFPLPDGTASECDPNSANPCCSKWGYCGPGADHCECDGCKDYRTGDQVLNTEFDESGLVRLDRRCGVEFPVPGTQTFARCNPESSNFCCSKWGYCGGDSEHCDCPECVNFKVLGRK